MGTDFSGETTETATGNTTRSDLASSEQKEDGQKKEPLAVRSDCTPVPTSKIRTKMENLLKETQKVKRAKRDKKINLAIDTSKFDEKIEELTKKMSKLVAADMKSITAQIEKTTIEKVNTEMKKKFYEVPINERQKLKEEVEKVNDELSCAFRNIMDGLETLVLGLLEDMVKNAVTAPPCMANNMIGAMLGQIANAVAETLKDILGGLNDLLDFPSPIEEPSQGGIEGLNIIDDIVSL